MRRKVYATNRERKIDQLIGFVAFPLVNGVLWFVTNRLLAWAAVACRGPDYDLARACILLMPWIINGIVIALAFLFRPAIGDGYIACIGVALFIPLVLSILFVAACFSVGLIQGAIPRGMRYDTWVYRLTFCGPMLLGLLLLGLGFLAWAVRWWRRE